MASTNSGERLSMHYPPLTMFVPLHVCSAPDSRPTPHRHITIPLAVAKLIPEETPLLTEHEWRSLGIRQSRGWIHYGYFPPHRSVLLFRRPLPGTRHFWDREEESSSSEEEEVAEEDPAAAGRRGGEGGGEGSLDQRRGPEAAADESESDGMMDGVENDRFD